MQDSGLCASCHNLKTTVVDPDTVQPVEPAQKFPEQAVYTEWEASAFADDGSSCQDCHMPTTANAALSTRPPRNLPQRNGVSQHHFVGGNAYMLDLFQQNRDLLGIQASEAALKRTLDRTVASLESAADVTVNNVRMNDGLQFDVMVTNNTGHKLPTSFPSRRVWLHVQVLDAAGQVLFESGAPADDGAIEGVAADTDATEFERHQDSITAEGQVAVWEPIMKNVNEKVTYTLMEAADYAKDNRILADGMAKGSLPSEVAVHGDADSDPDFEAGQDTVTYDLAPGGTPNRIRVELLYQSVSYRFRRDLVTGTGGDSTEVDRFQQAHGKSRRPYETLVRMEKNV